MLNIRVKPDGTIDGNHPGVAIVALPDGGFSVQVDPLVAHHLQGSKRQLAAMRQAQAIGREPWENERKALTDVLMKVTLALSALVESYDWLLQSPTSGLDTEGRTRIQAFFLATAPAARRALTDARGVDIDWAEVVNGGRKPERLAGPLPSVWATMGTEVAPAVNGAEGAALLQVIDALAQLEPDMTFDADVDWLYEVYALVIHGAGNCRALMEADPTRRDFAHKLYSGLMAVSLNVGRQLALRQLATEAEAPIVPHDAPPEETGPKLALVEEAPAEAAEE